MDFALDGGRTVQTVLVCHPNKVLLHIGKLHAERQGLRVLVAKNGKDVLVKARREVPDLIVLSNDLKDPTTDELVTALESEMALRGTRVVVVKGALPNISDILGKFPRTPWQQ